MARSTSLTRRILTLLWALLGLTAALWVHGTGYTQAQPDAVIVSGSNLSEGPHSHAPIERSTLHVPLLYWHKIVPLGDLTITTHSSARLKDGSFVHWGPTHLKLQPQPSDLKALYAQTGSLDPKVWRSWAAALLAQWLAEQSAQIDDALALRDLRTELTGFSERARRALSGRELRVEGLDLPAPTVQREQLEYLQKIEAFEEGMAAAQARIDAAEAQSLREESATEQRLEAQHKTEQAQLEIAHLKALDQERTEAEQQQQRLEARLNLAKLSLSQLRTQQPTLEAAAQLEAQGIAARVQALAQGGDALARYRLEGPPPPCVEESMPHE